MASYVPIGGSSYLRKNGNQVGTVNYCTFIVSLTKRITASARIKVHVLLLDILTSAARSSTPPRALVIDGS